jgi:tetraacyldisaccharide 4'-kinase
VPLDLLYASVAAHRRAWFERHPEARGRLRQPVISVGNLSVGGTGKTPLVSQIATLLLSCGERPAILSRGYGRSVTVDGVVVVSDGTTVLAGLDVAGDEPLMLARELREAIVCVCDDRYLAGVVAERALGATVHVLDDGFQHVQLARDLDILVTAPGEITHGHVLPRGRLRERREAAARAHFVIVVGAGIDAARAEAWELGIGAFSAARRRLLPGAPGAPGALGALGAGVPVFAVAGVGQPDQFFRLLRAGGVDVRGTLTVPDHHRYTAADVSRIAVALQSAGAAAVITTAKDAVRFEGLAELPFALQVAPLHLDVDGWEPLTLSIRQALEQRRSAA